MNLVTDLFEIERESGVVRNKIMLNRDVADGYLLEIGKLFVYTFLDKNIMFYFPIKHNF